jgi:hypothetical protein
MTVGLPQIAEGVGRAKEFGSRCNQAEWQLSPYTRSASPLDSEGLPRW